MILQSIIPIKYKQSVISWIDNNNVDGIDFWRHNLVQFRNMMKSSINEENGARIAYIICNKLQIMSKEIRDIFGKMCQQR